LKNFDVNAQEYILAAGITDTTEQDAVNQLTVDLKANNLWDKFKAIYPVLGGTSTTQKYNLVDPRDTDAAFRLTWNGPITHSSTGAVGTVNAGDNTFANTHLAPASHLGLDSTHVSYYSRTSNFSVECAEAGVYDTNKTIYVVPQFNGVTSCIRAVNNTPGIFQTSVGSDGLIMATRTSSGSAQLIRNGVVEYNDSYTSSALSTNDVYLMAINNTVGDNFNSDREMAFASIGEGMTATEAATFYDIVQAFQTTLGRQV